VVWLFRCVPAGLTRPLPFAFGFALSSPTSSSSASSDSSSSSLLTDSGSDSPVRALIISATSASSSPAFPETDPSDPSISISSSLAASSSSRRRRASRPAAAVFEIAEQSLAPREPLDLHATQITKPTGRGDQVIGNRGIGDLDPVVTPLKGKFNATTRRRIDNHVQLTSTTRGPTFPVR